MNTTWPPQGSTNPTSSNQLCDSCHQKPKYQNSRFCSKTCAKKGPTTTPATPNQVHIKAGSPPLCQHCHTKPSYQGSDYCSKTCMRAAQTVSLCKNCNQKPRHGTHDFCGKHCANQASLNTNNVSTKSTPHSSMPGSYVPSANSTPSGALRPSNNAKKNPIKEIAGAFVRYFLPSSTQNKSKSTSHDKGLRCQYGDCDREAFRDDSGTQISKYCSFEHSRQVVTQKKADPNLCIMCQQRPQSQTDYFCSSGCRNEALNKFSEGKEPITRGSARSSPSPMMS